MIEVRNITKKYGDHIALDDVSFNIEKGKVYGLLGVNGAGKSTTMNIITGYIPATGGSVVVNGYDMAKKSDKAKKYIGYLPEIPPLYPDMTVMEYMKFVSGIKKLRRSDSGNSIEEAMQKTGIYDCSHRLIKNLSKGYRQRVGLAQAILGNPEVIILDEPMVGLDPKQIIEIRQLIRSLAKEHAVILSSHILSEVKAVCDYIMIISKGKLVASDYSDKLMDAFNGERCIELSVLGNAERLTAVISNIDGVESFEVSEAEEKTGMLSASIKIKDDNDIRKELFYRLASEDMPIMELNYIKKSLEDIFMELTNDLESENSSEDEFAEESEKSDSDESDEQSAVLNEINEEEGDINESDF